MSVFPQPLSVATPADPLTVAACRRMRESDFHGDNVDAVHRHRSFQRRLDIIASWTASVHWQDEKRNMGFWPGSR